MERAGVDIVSDGEMRRESYSNRFATALEGIDLDNPGVAIDRTGNENPVPRVVGPIRRSRPVEVRDVEFLRANTDRPIKITLPGPFTMAQQAQNDHYDDEESLALAYAAAVNEEARDLKAAGADVVQIDEPYLQARPGAGARIRAEGDRPRAPGHHGDTALHICFGYGHIVSGKASRLLLPRGAERLHRPARSRIETAQPQARPVDPSTPAGKDDHPRRHRPLRPRARRNSRWGRRQHPTCARTRPGGATRDRS